MEKAVCCCGRGGSAGVGLVNSAFAQQGGTWTFNGGGNWSDSTRWVENFVPSAIDAGVVFGGDPLATLSPTLDSNRTVGTLVFQDTDQSTPGGWVLNNSGGAILRMELTSGTPTITVNGLGTNTAALGTVAQRIANITAPLSGTQGLHKQGGGTLMLSGNNTGLSGTVTVSAGQLMLGHANAIGTTGSLILRAGNLGLRNDVSTAFNIGNLEIKNNAVIGVGNAITGSGYGAGFNNTHTIGNVQITALGQRTLTISGSNGYGLTMGTLSIGDGLTLNNVGNDNTHATGDTGSNAVNLLGSGLLTIDRIRINGTSAGQLNIGGAGSLAGSVTITNGIAEIGGGAYALDYSGDKTLTIGGATGLAHSGQTVISNNGTVIVSADNLGNGQDLTIRGGSLIFNGSNLAHSAANFTLGGATVSAGAVTAHLNMGSNGSLTSGLITVLDSFLTDGTSTNTVASIVGNMNLDPGETGDQVVDVRGANSSLTASGVLSGTEGIIKNGKGSLVLTNANTFGGNLTINDGGVVGTAQAGAGTPFGTSGVNVAAGGYIRLNGIGSAQTESIGNYTATDTGSESGITVDATAGGATTLSISGAFTRSTRGTVKVTGVTDSLGTNEHVVVGAAPGPIANSMLAPYFAVQHGGGPGATLSFGSYSGNQIVAAAYNATDNLAGAGASDRVNLTTGSPVALGSSKTIYALGVQSGITLNTSSNTLTVGDGAFGGVILNGGAAITGSGTLAGSGELDIWSGGASENTISSGLSLNGLLTTAGSQGLRISGPVNLGGARDISVTGGTVAISGALSNHAITKYGGGILAIDGTQTPAYTSGITIERGVLQVGTGGTTGDLGTAAITNNTNGTLTFRRSNAGTFANAISGAGALVQDAGTDTGFTTLTGALTFTGPVIARSGTLRATPSGTGGDTVGKWLGNNNLIVERLGTFDLSGRHASFATLNGIGTVTTSTNSGVPATLTINSGSFGGSIRNGVNGSALALVKNSSGVLILTGANSFSGGISVTGGTLRLDSAAAAASGNGNPAITLQNANLQLNTPANQVLGSGLTVPANSIGTIILTGQDAQAAGSNDDSSQGFTTLASTAGSNGGNTTLVLDIRGRQMQIGGNASFAAPMANFSGTLKFLDTNPVGSRFRWPQGNGTGNSLNTANNTTFAFGSGNLLASPQGGWVTVEMGAVSGGTNTTLSGTQSVDLRLGTYSIGALAGNHTFAGHTEDWAQRGGNAPVALVKAGASSSLTLHGSLRHTGNTSISAGTLILGSGSNFSGTPTISVAGGATLAFAGGTYSGSQKFIRLVDSSSALNVSAHSSYSTPAGVTYLGGGSIYGNVLHNAGIIAPGSLLGTPGTMTFSDNLTTATDGKLWMDITSGSAGVLGGGVNDLLQVNVNNGLAINGGLIRLNVLGAGSAGLVGGDYFPLINYNGAVQGAGLSALKALAVFHGSFDVVAGTGTLANTIGVQVVNVGGSTVDLTWAPTVSNIWDAVAEKNFTPTVGSGSLLFFNGDTVTFDDTAANKTVVLGQSGLMPTAITVNTTATYVFTGSGSITGGATLVKNGSGTLSIRNFSGNNFSGGLTVNDGVVIADREPATGGNWIPWGTGTITLNGDAGLATTAILAGNNQSAVGYAAMQVNGDNRIEVPSNGSPHSVITSPVFGNGTLTLVRTNDSQIKSLDGNMTSFTGTLRFSSFNSGGAWRQNTNMLGGPSVTFDLGGASTTITQSFPNAAYSMGALMSSGPATVSLNGSSSLTIGQKNLNTTYMGVFTGDSNASIIKAGTATLTLTGSHTYTSRTTINEGTVTLVHSSSNNIGSSPIVTIDPGATLNVSGLNGGAGGITLGQNQILRSNGQVVGGDVTVQPGSTVGGTNFGATSKILTQFAAGVSGTIAPGNSVGTLNVGTLSLDDTTIFQIEVDGANVDGVNVLQPDGVDIAAPTGGDHLIQMVNLGSVVPGTYSFLDYPTPILDDPTAGGGWENLFTFAPFGFGLDLVRNDALSRLEIVISANDSKWFKDNGLDGWTSTKPENFSSDYVTPSTVLPNNVEFGTFITAPQTVSMAASGQFVNKIVFNSPISYTITGDSTLTLDAGVPGPVITVLQGNHSVFSTVRFLHEANFNIESGSSLTFGGTIVNANNTGLTKSGNGTAVFARLNMNTGSLTVGAGTVVISAKPTSNSVAGTSVVRNLTVAAGAKLNLTNNAMVVDTSANPTSGQMADVRAMLADGRLFSTSADLNATNPTAIGYRSNVNVASPTAVGMGALASFGGAAVDQSSILMGLTYAGDTNLDFVVNVLDMYNLASNWLNTGLLWQQGDFNYDGIVNAVDLGLLSKNWLQSFTGEGIEGGMTFEQALAMVGGLGGTSVPEPSSLALVGIATAGLLRRRRRLR